jgi:uncharacterized protein (TIGR02118 family)
VTEHLLVALWRGVGTSPDELAAGLTDGWAREALIDESVESCTVSLADPDQGPYTREPDANGLVPNCDALVSLGLARAHDLDDVPARDLLHALARRMEVWRIDPRRQLAWDRTWPDGEYAPGIKMVSFMQRADAISHEQFGRAWTEGHTPLAIRHHVGLWNYTQNVVRRAYTPGGGSIDGVAELHFRSRHDFVDRFYDSDEGRAAILADVKRFMGRARPETALMRELPLRTRSTERA